MSTDASNPESASLPLLVLRNQVIFPGSTAQVDVQRAPSRAVVEAATRDGASREVVAFIQRDPALDDLGDVLGPDPAAAARSEGMWPVGVRARIDEVHTREDGNLQLRVTALARVELDSVQHDGVCHRAATHEVFDASTSGADAVRRVADLLGDLAAALPEEVLATLASPAPDSAAASRLADVVADSFAVSVEERAEALVATDLAARVDLLVPLVERKRTWARTVQEFRIPPIDQLAELWPLTDGGTEEIDALFAAGEITSEDARDLHHYVEHGWVVWEKLVPEADIDALVDDVRTIARHPGRFLTTDHRRGYGYRFSDTDFDSFESIFDTYVNHESARRVCFHPRVLRLLELLFRCKPVAMQQLLFQRSNQHPLHQDTAYVRVQDPLQLAATWIALEDVVEGRGELTYYDRSHRIPHQSFHMGAKWFDQVHDDGEAAIAHVKERSEELGCEKRSFIAKKGDVFLWAADLVHGSNPRTRPVEETRLSCVTHYVPETAKPLWFLFSPDRRGLEAYGERAWLASSHYELPRTEDGFLRPTFKLPLPC
jgi:phytanoyl-CoA hydroxylase